MGQRTKWGNCSAGRNLSFNWRLILAPDFVLRYLVTHEAVHLAVPDHSAKFWLTVQSLCPEMERAKQWLRLNALKIAVKLDDVCEEIGPPGRQVNRSSRPP
jgi:predicted metal-dependent hydrolase